MENIESVVEWVLKEFNKELHSTASPKKKERLDKIQKRAYEMEYMQKIEFAKLHVELALKAASENVILDYGDYITDGCYERIIDKDSILKSYPLSNIK